MKALYPCEDNWDLLCEFYDRVTKIANRVEEATDEDEPVSELIELIELCDATERRIY